MERIRERIEAARSRAGRVTDVITLIAVSKTMPSELILDAIGTGLVDFGENRVQEAEQKIERIGRRVRWHLIGHLQSNKARKAVQLFDCIHSVDSPQLAERLDRIAGESAKRFPILLQIDLGGEPTKHGFEPDELFKSVEGLSRLPNVEVKGLMALPPFREDPEEVRPFFRQLASLLAQINEREVFPTPLTDLSMGMSHDFEVAIEEGATMIRVGTAVFGERTR